MSETKAQMRLGAYFFLQYFMLGVWFVALGTYMSKSLGFDAVIGWAYAAQGLAALIASPFAGALADRWMPARKLLASLMVASSLTLFALSQVAGSEALFLALVFAHFLAFVPTIPLTNAVCLNALADPDRQFSRIRVLGTVGWIAGGVLIGAIPDALLTPLPMTLAAGTGLLLAGAAFVLPDLPVSARPEPVTLSRVLGLDVIRAIRNRSFWAVCGCAALLSMPLAFYNAYCNNFLQESGVTISLAGRTFEPTAIQAMGQVSELAFLLLLPLVLRFIGIGGVLVIGMLGWVARAAVFALGFPGMGEVHTELLVSGILLHGVCYDFILIGAALYVDKAVDRSGRSRAQSFLTMITMGAGISLGSIIANYIYGLATLADDVHDWRMMWIWVGAISLGALTFFAFTFRDWRVRKGPPSSRIG